MTKKSVKKAKSAKLPTKKVGSFSLIKIKRLKTKKTTKLVITLSLPRIQSKKKKATKKYVSAQQFYSKSVSVILITMSVLGFAYTVNALYNPAKPKAVDVSRVAQQLPTAATAKSLASSVPLSLEIPAISLTAPISGVGQNSDGSMEVPSDPNMTGWYTLAPTPGEIGPAIIVGHVDSLNGPAIFWNLNKLKPGDLVNVKRQDGSTATFKVDKQEVFQQDNFPTDQVYGNIEHAGLRLITCSGEFNQFTRHYSHNIVVYATLVI